MTSYLNVHGGNGGIFLRYSTAPRIRAIEAGQVRGPVEVKRAGRRHELVRDGADTSNHSFLYVTRRA